MRGGGHHPRFTPLLACGPPPLVGAVALCDSTALVVPLLGLGALLSAAGIGALLARRPV